MSQLYIGLMSGTSIDGIDAGLVDFNGTTPQLIEFNYQPYSDALRFTLNKITSSQQPVLLEDLGHLDSQLGYLFADTVNQLLNKVGFSSNNIKAIGSHGHTIYHAPNLNPPFSIQIGDPNIIAEKTGITTIADFRRRDIAANGQGAPLVPAFHQAFFSNDKENRVVLNIGGIANITALVADNPHNILGFDTGPGNTLLDQWINQHHTCPYDKNGDWGKSGKVIKEVVEKLKQDPYFALKAPKSTGKEYFSLAWLNKNISNIDDYRPEDIQASLTSLTAETITEAIKQCCTKVHNILVCGGGAHNELMVEFIQKNIDCPVLSTEKYGLHPDHVEATAFAWLARQTLNRKTGNLVSVTGASKAVILGGIYQA